MIGTADNVIPESDQLSMAYRANSHITLVDGVPHLSMISNPRIVTRVIEPARHGLIHEVSGGNRQS